MDEIKSLLDNKISRRMVFKTAGAVGVMMAANPILGQQVSGQTQRTKGPPVWLDMDQKELDDAYDQSVYAPNQELVAKRRRVASEAAIKRLGAPQRVAHGTQETPEFQRQSREFAAAVKAAGKPVQFIVGEGFNHFEMHETLGNPYGIAGRAALEQMQLTPRGA